MFFSSRQAAKNKRRLQAHHITHVLNAAHGQCVVSTGPGFYQGTKIAYHGVKAFDLPNFNLSRFFHSAANFIRDALSTPKGEELSARSGVTFPKHLSVTSHL